MKRQPSPPARRRASHRIGPAAGRDARRLRPRVSPLEGRALPAATVTLMVAAPVVSTGSSFQFTATETGGGGGTFSLQDETGRVVDQANETTQGRASFVVQATDTPNPGPLSRSLAYGHHAMSVSYQPATGAAVTASLDGGVDAVSSYSLPVSASTTTATPGQVITLTANFTDPNGAHTASFFDYTTAGVVPLGSAQSGESSLYSASIQVALGAGEHHIGVVMGYGGSSSSSYNILPTDPIIARATTTAALVETPSLALQNGPASLYLFNDGSGAGVHDASGNGHDAVAPALATFSSDVPPPQAAGLSLDTANGDPITNAPLATASTDNVTMTAWVKWSAAQGTAGEAILYQGDTSFDGFGLYVAQGSPSILVGGQTFLTSTNALPVGQWTFLAASRRDGAWLLTMDGVSQPFREEWTTPAPNVPSLGTSIGGTNSGGERFRGLINQPAIFASALSDETLSALAGERLSFTLTVAPVTPNPDVPPVGGSAQILVDGVSTDVLFAVTEGSVRLFLPPLAIGVHTISATYSGDADHTPSTSATLVKYVQPTLTLSVPATAIYGQSIRYVASVPSTLAGVGMVTFLDGSTVLARDVAVNSEGQAILTPGRDIAGAGSRAITAIFRVPGQAATDRRTSAIVISPRTLVVTAAGVVKTYDRTATAAVVLTDDHIIGDDVRIASAPATFGDAQAGAGKRVTVGNLSLSGTAAANYRLAGTSVTTTASINRRALTVTATGADRVYNGTTDATVRLANDALSGDVVTVAYASARFATRQAGSARIVTVDGLGLDPGGAGANYYLATPRITTSASITPRDLVVQAVGADRTYNGTTGAAVTLVGDALPWDSIALTYGSARFASKQVGINRSIAVAGITLSGDDAGNYTLSNAAAATTASITPRPLIVTGTGVSRAYDGTAAAAVVLADDRIAGDQFIVISNPPRFLDADPGRDKPIPVTDLQLVGPDAGDYAVVTTDLIATATIDPLGSQAAITILPSPRGLAQFFEFRAVVNPVGGVQVAFAGVVRFAIDGRPVAEVPVSEARRIAAVPDILLPVGTHSITAIYLPVAGPLGGSLAAATWVVLDPAIGGNRLAIDGAGNRYIADTLADVVIKTTPAGVTTIFGAGKVGFDGDGGPAVAATFDGPTGLAVDAQGNLYVADTGNNRVRMITPDGVIRTVAGTGAALFTAESGPSTGTALDGPTGLAVDERGELYIADTGNNRIRLVAANGTMTTIAGGGSPGLGAASSNGQLTRPTGLALGPQNALYVADTGNYRVVKLAPPVVGLRKRSASSTWQGTVLFTTSAAAGGPRLQPTVIAVGPAGDVIGAFMSSNLIFTIDAGGSDSNFPPTTAISGEPVTGLAFNRSGGFVVTSGFGTDPLVTPVAAGDVFGGGGLGGSGTTATTSGGSLQFSAELLAPGPTSLGLYGTVSISTAGQGSQEEGGGSTSAAPPNQTFLSTAAQSAISGDEGGTGHGAEGEKGANAEGRKGPIDPWAWFRALINKDEAAPDAPAGGDQPINAVPGGNAPAEAPPAASTSMGQGNQPTADAPDAARPVDLAAEIAPPGGDITPGDTMGLFPILLAIATTTRPARRAGGDLPLEPGKACGSIETVQDGEPSLMWSPGCRRWWFRRRDGR